MMDEKGSLSIEDVLVNKKKTLSADDLSSFSKEVCSCTKVPTYRPDSTYQIGTDSVLNETSIKHSFFKGNILFFSFYAGFD